MCSGVILCKYSKSKTPLSCSCEITCPAELSTYTTADLNVNDQICLPMSIGNLFMNGLSEWVMLHTFQQYCMIPGSVHIIQYNTTYEYRSIQIIPATTANTFKKDHVLHYNNCGHCCWVTAHLYHTSVQWPSTNTLQHWLWQNAFPTVQCCSARQARNRHLSLLIHLWWFAAHTGVQWPSNNSLQHWLW